MVIAKRHVFIPKSDPSRLFGVVYAWIKVAVLLRCCQAYTSINPNSWTLELAHEEYKEAIEYIAKISTFVGLQREDY